MDQRVTDPSLSDKTFLCGVAVSMYQNSGDKKAQWANFEQKKLVPFNFRVQLSGSDLENKVADDKSSVENSKEGSDHDIQELVKEEDKETKQYQKKSEGTLVEAHASNATEHTLNGNGHDKRGEEDDEKKENPKIDYKVHSEGVKVGQSSDFWNNYELDIELAKELGCNSFRISLEWSRLFPAQDQLDEEAVQRYHNIFDCLERAGMTPNVTLHWFAHPQWFQDLGEFQKEENIPLFVDWAETAFALFGKRAQLWATFNEPEVASLCGHIMGNHPPGKVMQFKDAGRKLCTMLRAHAAAYKAIKAMPGGKHVAVGLVHNVWWVEPKKVGPMYKHVEVMTKLVNQLWGNGSLMQYLKTGVYTYKTPLGQVRFEDPDGKPGCDFFGINHYARGVVDWKFSPSSKFSKVLLADMGYPIDPHSLYKAIAWASQLEVPMYVMENGAPFDKDDTRRTEWINSALEQVKTAVKDGYDLRGYHYWTLLDNFEWNFAYDLKFGLYEWDREDPAGKRTLRNGAKVIKGWYAALPGEMQQVMKDLADTPYTVDRNALPQDSRAPSEATSVMTSRAAAHALRHPCWQPSRLNNRLSLLGTKGRAPRGIAPRISRIGSLRLAL